MFTLEKITFANPLSAKKPDSIEYVIVHDSKNVLFGQYSEAMTQFYRFAKQREVLASSSDIYDLLPHFRSAYTSPTQEEYAKILIKRYRKQPKRLEKGMRMYNHSKYLYCYLPDCKKPRPSHSIFVKFIILDILPNDDENTYKLRDIVDEISEAIEQQALVYSTLPQESCQQLQKYA